MLDIIVLIEDVDSFEKFKEKLPHNATVFSFDFRTHNHLKKEEIPHKLAEEYIDSNDRLMIFDLTVSSYNWHKKKEFLQKLILDDINLLGILDTAELHMLLIHHLTNFLIIKRIIEKEKPSKIIVTKSFHDLLIPLLQKHKIELEILEGNLKYYLEWDRIELKFNIFNKPISLRISRSTYNKIKSTFENIICTIFNLWSNTDNKNKTILFLEFNPSAYPNLLKNLHKYKQNILFFNRRRPAIWNLQSINLLRKNNCKLVNVQQIQKSESVQIISLTNHYLDKLKEVWSNDEQFSNIFIIEGFSIWSTIKQILFDTYKNRFKEYVALVVTTKKIFEKSNISCILCSNVFGETEKVVLDINKNLKPSVLLEHGYANYTLKIERYDILSMYQLFRDKIAVWGEIQKKYLVEQKGIDSKRIIVCGSPRHDSFFIKEATKKQNLNKNVLLTIHSINEVSGQADTNLYVEFEDLLRKIYTVIKNFKNVNLVVKLHPNQDIHNQDIKKLVNDIDATIPIYQLKSIKELLVSCDTLINISPEGFDPSTVLLEGLILNKPTMNIVIDNQFYGFQYEKDNAILSISANSDLEKHLGDLIFNKDLRETLIINGKNHINNYLANHGTASEYLAKYLSTL